MNDAPAITAGATILFTEGDAAKVIDNTITVADVDDTNLESATVQITGNYVNGQDVLAMPVSPGIGTAFDAPSGTLTLLGSATLAQYQAALRTVTYFNGSNAPSPLTRTVTWIVHDGDQPEQHRHEHDHRDPGQRRAARGAQRDVSSCSGTPSCGWTCPRGRRRTRPRPRPARHRSRACSTTTAIRRAIPSRSTAIANCRRDTTAPFDCTLTAAAVVHVEATGEFSYTPAPGATSGSFTYTVTDTPSVGLPSSASGTVSFTFVDTIWYVNGTVAGPGTGTSIDPFNNFARSMAPAGWATSTTPTTTSSCTTRRSRGASSSRPVST